MSATDCEFCMATGGELIWQDGRCRVVRCNEADYPGFCRVIWSAHVREMTDLSQADREHLMRVVHEVERALRDTLDPLKINLASLGNLTPHVHWHVIPRFADDRHFPKPVWSEPQREAKPRPLPEDWMRLMAAVISEELSLDGTA